MRTRSERTTMLRAAASVVTAALLGTATHATPPSQSSPRLTPATSLDEELAAAITRGDVPGLVVMAATRDRVLYQGAFGKADTALARPMTVDALFRIASMTKAVTSVAAM